MQKLTGKEIIVRKSEVEALLADALCFHDFADIFVRTVKEKIDAAHYFAFLTGVRLLQIKPDIPSGDWQTWLEMNFCNPRGITERWARNYTKIASDNIKLVPEINWKRASAGDVDFELVKKFKFDSQRKYAITFVPEKSQPEHEDNVTFPRLALMTNIVNEFERIFSRHVDGLQLIDLEKVRGETAPLYRFLKCVHETPEVDPFAT